MLYRSPPADSTPPPPPLPPLRDQIIPELRAVVHPCKEDIFWTAGLYSNFVPLQTLGFVPLQTLGEIRKKTGLKVVTTFYDLIRVTHPQFNPASMSADWFAADAIAMLDNSDLVFAISNWSRSQLLEFAKQVGRPAPEVVAIPLGCDLSTRERPTALVSNLLQRRFALSVGTIEPRKNYALLLSIWEKLCDNPAFQMDLAIVGRPGGESSVAEITNSPLFNRRIHWWRHCTDATLRQLYESCHLFVYPSFVEGWGLPVTEALALGCPVMASARGAIPEASYGLAQLLDPSDEKAWTEAISTAARKRRGGKILEKPPTWDAAAAAVANRLAQLSEFKGVW
jgi:glycosyltransferase involved in cell wall biosynthesis